MLNGRRWWWWAIAAGLNITIFTNPIEIIKTYLIPIVWQLPLTIWSEMGNRERKNTTSQMVFSSARPVLGLLTGGAFDITVKPLLDLYQTTPGSLPGTRQIQHTLGLVDYRKINLSETRIAFQQPSMAITLDGIAKGFIVDEGVAVLRQLGFENILVEAGGDLMGLGEKKPHNPWKINLQAPRKEMGSLIATFSIHNQAVATSGDYMQAFTPDFANHHIIDPRTGHSPLELASASVSAPSAVLADGLATAVMGTQGIHLIENLADCEAYLITKGLDVLKTPGLPRCQPVSA